ncbi:MAG: DUF192 domain-containing protein [Candidatus Sedimenticola endophacoides]
MKWLTAGVCGVALLWLAGCTGQERIEIRVDGARATVELARTPEQRARELMQRYQLDEGEGMLLVYPRPQTISLWMKDVPIPLDAAFFDEQGALVNIRSMIPDGGKRVYYSQASALYALEMKQGWFARQGIGVGARLHLPRVIRAQ